MASSPDFASALLSRKLPLWHNPCRQPLWRNDEVGGYANLALSRIQELRLKLAITVRHANFAMTSNTPLHDHASTLSPVEQESDHLRADSPFVIEEDDDLLSFLQRETTDDPSTSPSFETDALHPDHAPDHETTSDGSGTEPAKLTSFILILTLTACISGLLFGYDTGVISSTLVSVGTELTAPNLLGTLDKSLITSCTSLFALVASPPAGWLADRRGRRGVIVVADILFVVGAALQAFSTSVWMMVVGRSVVGLAVGAASLVVPLYISELAPPEFRGRLVVVNVLFITGGQMLAYLLGWQLAALTSGWRWMVGIGAVPAAIQLWLLMFLPETPRWLVRQGRNEEARSILNRAYGQQASASVDTLVRAIAREVLEEEEATRLREPRKTGSWLAHRPAGWRELFEIPGNRRALTIACLLQALQQLCGFNSLMYFSASIFLQLGFQSPILASLSVAITNFVFTVVAMLLIDRIGRRRILLITIPVMILGLILSSLSFWLMGSKHESAVHSNGLDLDFTTANSWPTLILISIVIYVAAYATGLGNVPWQQSELFPLAVRSLGCGISTATAWGSNFLVGLTFLPFMQLLGPSWTFVLYAVICGLGLVLVVRIYPETKGMGLEEVGKLLKDGWGVERRTRLRRQA